MAQTTRIPESLIAQVKNIPLGPVVKDSGVELVEHGDNATGHCPFHKEETPSFIVTRSVNLYHCFGCGAAGSPIDFIQQRERVGFRKAVAILLQQYLHLVADDLAAPTPAKQAPAINFSASDQKLLNEVVAYYHSQVAEARLYLESRGLDDEEMINKHQLGICNRTLGYHLPIKQVKAGKEVRMRLTEIGILRESGHETFSGSLVIPIFDESGNVVEIYGRKINNDLRKGTPLHLFLKGPHRGVWNWQGLVDEPEVILCEALIDALTIYRAGFHAVTASYGVNGFSPDHLAALQRYGTKRVLIAYDRDEAGERAARELAEKLGAVGIKCYRTEFPLGMDANEYAQQIARD